MNLYRKDNISLIENLKAFAILFCASHLPQDSMFPELTSLGILIGNSGVPLFVMLSAYFMKSDFEKKSMDFIKNIFSMYLFVSLLYFIFACIVNATGVFDKKCQLFHNGGVFYLELLMIWKIVIPYIRDLRLYIQVFLVIAMIVGVPLIPNLKIELLKAFSFYTPFFLLGLKINWIDIVKFRDSRAKYFSLIYVIPVLILGYYVIEVCHDFSNISPVFYSIRRFLSSIAIILFCFGFFSGYKNTLLHRFGSKCLLIYLFHVMILTWLYGHFLYPTFIKGNFDSFISSFISFGVYCLTLFILSFDFEYRIFFKIIKSTRRFLFKE